MKLKQIITGAFLTALIASCSNDLPVPDDGKILENETTTYVRVSLMGEDSATKADEPYENGTSDENAINRILLVFFDAGRNYVGRTVMEIDDTNSSFSDGTSNTIDKILTVVAPVNLPENINYPKYVVALVNPTSAYSDLAVDKLEDMMGMIRQRSQVSHTGTRSMNNSVYFNTESGYLNFATEVDFHTHFFSSMEEAKNATDATIEITVERIEAKVRLQNSLNELNPKPYETSGAKGEEEKYTLEFVPEAWFVNGTEKRSFLLKNYRSIRNNYLSGHMSEDDFGMDLNSLKEAFKNGNDNRENEVNDASNLRSYWAIDPTYFILTDNSNNLYPDVSYDVLYGSVNPAGQNYPLQYRSYANVMKEKNEHVSTNYVKFNETVKSCEYVLENTLSLQTLKSTNAKAAMASVVLLGHYQVKNAAKEVIFDGNTTDKNKSFYVRHEANASKIVLISDEEAINFFLERGGSTLCVQRIDKDGNPIAGEYEPLRAAHLKKGATGSSPYGVDYSDFSIVYPDKNFTGDNKLSEQWRTLDLKMKNGKYNDHLFIYDASLNNNTGGYRNINENDAAEVSSLKERMYSSFGSIEKFQTGKAYFNVPLKHIWRAGNSSNEFDAKNVTLGDYGVVRNHIYDLTINKIEGLGTGIGDIEQPIVPPTENENYYINTRLRILKWRLVDQSVDL